MMSCKLSTTDIRAEFDRLALFLAETGKIQDRERYSKNFPAFISFAFHLQSYYLALPFCSGKRVLDIGCFSGYGERILSSSSSGVIACDKDLAAIESGVSNSAPDNVLFLAADAEYLPFPEESFEVVTAFQILEHLPPDRVGGFLREIFRITRRGGVLLMTTPNRSFRLLPFQSPFNPEHYREYSLKQLRKALEEVYPVCRIKGLRAKKWIEEMEKDRVRQTPFQVYLRSPLAGIMRKIIPGVILSRLSEIQNLRSPREEADRFLDAGEQFDDCYRLFSMDDFYHTEKDARRAPEFFAICEKLS